jgi:hypothetical protein
VVVVVHKYGPNISTLAATIFTTSFPRGAYTNHTRDHEFLIFLYACSEKNAQERRFLTVTKFCLYKAGVFLLTLLLEGHATGDTVTGIEQVVVATHHVN